MYSSLFIIIPFLCSLCIDVFGLFWGFCLLLLTDRDLSGKQILLRMSKRWNGVGKWKTFTQGMKLLGAIQHKMFISLLFYYHVYINLTGIHAPAQDDQCPSVMASFQYTLTHNKPFSASFGDNLYRLHLMLPPVLMWILSGVCTAIFLFELMCSQAGRPTWQIPAAVVSNHLNPLCSLLLIQAGELFSLLCKDWHALWLY